jgi:alpha-1,6-mannosyltransferase
VNSTSASTKSGNAGERATGRQAAAALAGLTALETIFYCIFRLGDLKLYVVETIALALGAGIIYLVVVYALEHSADSRLTLWIVLAGALVFRATLLPLTPTLSDDIYRYQWEGRVQVAGFSPYVVVPSDPRAAPIRGPYWRRIPGPDIRAIYPPLTELILRTINKISDAPFAIKLALVAVESLALGLLALLLRATGRRMSLLVIYAWNPLVVVESAASGHNDSLAVAAVLAALLLIIRRRPVLSTLALATAILTKLFPLVLFPLWLRLVGWPRKARAWAAVGAAGLLAIACAWPYRADLPAIVTALQKVSNSFIDNASLFLVLQWLSGSMDWARGISAGVVAGLSIWVAARKLDPLRATYLLFGTILLVSQNAFSWYFVWIIPLLCFFPNPAWLLLTILQFLSYHVLIDYQAFDRFQFQPFFLWLTYGPSYALLLAQAFRAGHPLIPDKISAA